MESVGGGGGGGGGAPPPGAGAPTSPLQPSHGRAILAIPGQGEARREQPSLKAKGRHIASIRGPGRCLMLGRGRTQSDGKFRKVTPFSSGLWG